MSSDTSSSSPNASNARPRRRGILGGLGRAVKLAKRPPEVNDSAGDESDECTDSDLCELSSNNDTSDMTDAESSSTVYMDYNATTPLDREVLATIHRSLKFAWGNPSSSHLAGVKAKTLINESRQFTATMIGAMPEDIIFTSGGTEANNLVLNTAVEHFQMMQNAENHAQHFLPHIISSSLEHDSIKVVLERYRHIGKADVTFIDAVSGKGCVQVDDIINAVKPTTCLITVMLANNETGIIQPVAQISSKLKQYCLENGRLPILLHTDAAQAIGKISVNVDMLGVDYLTIVGHKFYGPRIGALYVRRPGLQTPLYPMFYGGGQERSFRPGTENTGMIAGFGKACEIVTRSVERCYVHMATVRDYLEQQLQETFSQGVCFNGKADGLERLPNTCNFSITGSHLQGHRILSHVKRLQASVGAACHSELIHRLSPVLLASGIPEDIAANAIRLSIGRGTELRDVDVVVADLKRAVNEILIEVACSE